MDSEQVTVYDFVVVREDSSTVRSIWNTRERAVRDALQASKQSGESYHVYERIGTARAQFTTVWEEKETP